MKYPLVLSASLLCAGALPLPAAAATVNIKFGGSGVVANLTLTYGTATDAKYPAALEVSAISGTFSDLNIGINGATVQGIVPITRATPDADNLLAPKDFSRFAVASGLDPVSNGFLTYDNLFWPGGAPQTASDYPAYGGVLDIYGLMFSIGNGRVVNLWSNGVFFGPAEGALYGAAVATAATALDYVGGLSAVVPEPGSWALTLLALGGASLATRRCSQAQRLFN